MQPELLNNHYINRIILVTIAIVWYAMFTTFLIFTPNFYKAELIAHVIAIILVRVKFHKLAAPDAGLNAFLFLIVMLSHARWVPCHPSKVYPQVADGQTASSYGGQLQIH
jgi:hypothetical protein